jgi:hypothetical protein
MNKILKEQKFQMTGCVAQECKVEAGQILGVGKIVNGSVGIVGKTYYLTLQLIDVKTGKVELSAEDECRCEIDELLGSTKRLAKKLLDKRVEQPAEAIARAKAEEEKVKAEKAARARAEEERIRAEQAARVKAEEERIKAAQIAKAKAEAEEAAREKARAEAIAKAKAEEAERAKAAQIAKAKAEAEEAAREKARTEAIARAKAEEAERVKAAQIAKARAEAEETARTKAKAEVIAKAETQKHEFKITTAAIDPAMTGAEIVAPDGRYVKLASGVVRDTQSGLDWYAGPDKNTGWGDVKQWTAGLKVDGGGWRMPTMKELKSLYRKSAASRNMTPLLETTGWLIWSGDTGSGPGGLTESTGWALDFDNGRELLERRDNSISKRGFAVRSTPKSLSAAIDPATVSTKIIASDGRFEKLASGVVRDTKNGLEWYAGPDAGTSQVEAKAWTEGLRIDGGRWRMPAISELKSLYQKGAGSRNMTPLLETDGWLVWSGETGVSPGGGDFKAWAVDFSDGREVLDRRANSNYTRVFAVRSASKSVTAETDPATVSTKIIASDGRFEKLASGVVRDTKSGLDWYAGPDKNTNWDDAKQLAAGLRVDGGGWRMPTINELKGLYRKGAGSRNMTQLLETTGLLVWSEETGVKTGRADESSVWALDFSDGREIMDKRDNSISKRGFAVRSTPKSSSAAVDPATVSTKIIASDGRFEKLASGVVRDTKSGLDWYAGPDKNTSWDDVKSWADKISVDGGGWRMPTRAELKSLYRKGAGSRNMTLLLETTGWLVWSGETGGQESRSSGNAEWAVDFDNGRELLDRRDNSIYKRGFAVRSRK